MFLEVSVHMYGAEVPAQSWTLTRLDEAEGIGMKVGRVVRDFVRTRPIRKAPTRLQLDIRATWREGAHVMQTAPEAQSVVSAPKRRRRKKAA
jgi:hypothetical protein